MTLEEIFGTVEGLPQMDLLEALSGMPVDYPSPSLMINRELTQNAEEHNNYGGLIMDGYHPSFMAHRTCPVSYYYHRTVKEARDLDPRTLRIFHNGDGVHSRLQRYLKNNLYGSWSCRGCRSMFSVNSAYSIWLEQVAGDKEDPERKKQAEEIIHRIRSYTDLPAPMPAVCSTCGCTDFRYDEWRVIDLEHQITGKMDGVLRNIKNEFVGWEIKSANSRSYSSLHQSSPLMLKYKQQFSIYLTVCGFKYGVITVECKDDQYLKDFPLSVESVDLTNHYNSMTLVNAVLAGDKALPAAYKNDDCKDCPYLRQPCEPSARK